MDEIASESGRLFLAILPDAEASARIDRLAGRLRRAHKFAGKLIQRERLHVSLFFLGEACENIVRMVGDAAANVRTEPFEVTFDRTVSFRGSTGSRPFVLVGEDGPSRLQSFRRALVTAIARKGLRGLAKTNFTPHITLLYDAQSVDEYPIEPISWTAREFVLVHSLKGHVHLARWPLRS
jgi:2'-5' RNA ligase